jgi:hypothetical protein
MPFETYSAVALSAALSVGMVRIAVRKQAVEERKPPRRCPCCGLLTRRQRCACSSR